MAQADLPKAEAPAKAAAKPEAAKKRTRRTFPEQKEFESMEAAILLAEEKVSMLEAKTSDPEQLRKLGAGLKGALAELDSARATVEKLYTRWAELSELDAYGR
ncbi:MAG: hypothetical protein KC933_22200 [Myxococcales bacterium]|nr:hypothetical protein [Myxococcales bacterium]